MKTKSSTENLLLVSNRETFLNIRRNSEKHTSRSILKEVHVDLEDDLKL